MGTSRMNFAPGVDIESTATASRGGWNSSNLIRYRFSGAMGWLEKLRGWVRLSDATMTGICRKLHYWADLSGLPWLAAGTNTNLYVENSGNLFDITPVGFVPGPASSGLTPFTLLIWSLDNFGQIGIFTPSRRGIYAWTPIFPPVGPAVLIGTAPPENQGAIVTMPQQIVMAYGSSPDAGTLDPMLIRWCAQSDYTDWTPSSTNQAGSFRISKGTRIAAVYQPGLATYIFTDAGFWTAQYIGFPLVFGFFEQGSECGLIAQNAVASLGIIVYWMSEHGFFQATGTSFQQIPCSVWDYVFLDIDTRNRDKSFAATNYHYNEISFFFPSRVGGTGEIDSYAKLNVQGNVWDVGRLIRTAWTDQTPDHPISVDLNRRMQQQDVGYDADDEPMVGVSAVSGYLDVSDGGDILLMTRLIPDALWEGNNPQFNVTVLVRSFPGDDPVECGPFTITPDTNYVTLGRLVPFPVLGIRGREVAFKITCDAPRSWWRIGIFRTITTADGKL